MKYETQNLSPDDKELWRRCDEVLQYIWDPIGVVGAPGARDEYDSYLPRVFALLRENAERVEVDQYLISVVTEYMGISPNLEQTQQAVDAMIAWRNWIRDRPPRDV